MSSHPLAEIPPEEVARAYRDRGLERLPDAELVAAVIDVIEVPRIRRSSFTLHAPLEALARFVLLDFVAPDARELARMQLVAIAASYARLEPVPAVAPRPGGATLEALARHIAMGDVDAADAEAAWLAGHVPAAQLVPGLGELFVDSLAVAMHGPIWLAQVTRVGPALAPLALASLRGVARELASDRDAKLGVAIPAGTGSTPVADDAIALEFWRGLASARRIGEPSGWGIAPLVRHAEQAGIPDEAMRGAWAALRDDPDARDAAFRGIARAAAQSMIEDAGAHARYGWSHCLTIPQGLWMVAPLLRRPTAALWLASVLAVASRSAHGLHDLAERVELPRDSAALADVLTEGPVRAAAVAYHAAPDQRAAVRRVLASQAAIRNDAHVSKYVLACLDSAAMDPARAPLYHASAAYLVAIWVREVPADRVTERLHVARS